MGTCRWWSRTLPLLGLASLAIGLPARVHAQVLTAEFAGSYTLTVLGSVPGLPIRYGGLTFVDNNIILIGGKANELGGRLYTIGVVRDAAGHITGFVDTATQYGSAGEYNDGGVVFGPGGVLFLARWPVRELGQVKPGSTDENKIITLTTTLGMPYGPGGLAFVPPGLPGAGQLKIVAYDDAKWYTVAYAPDGAGTYTLSSAVLNVTLSGAPRASPMCLLAPRCFPSPASSCPSTGTIRWPSTRSTGTAIPFRRPDGPSSLA